MSKTVIFRNKLPETVGELFTAVVQRPGLPDRQHYTRLLQQTAATLQSESGNIRPNNQAGFPGGIVYLKQTLPTILVPDIHSRTEFLLSILFYRDSTGLSILEKMGMDLVQLVCLGDGIHAEERARNRWAEAFKEFQGGFATHEAMDEEMQESLVLMEMVMQLKRSFPDNFHFLKGNHENILNGEEHGNHPFAKFAYEGPMVLLYMRQFYGEQLLREYDRFERLLPLLAVGRNFIASHAEPRRCYRTPELLNYRTNPQVIEGLTWTDNGEAEPESVQQMINHHLPPWEQKAGIYFTGHRAVSGRYALRAEGRLIQLHNPNKYIIAAVNPSSQFDPDSGILELNPAAILQQI